eukprot:g6464.t1
MKPFSFTFSDAGESSVEYNFVEALQGDEEEPSSVSMHSSGSSTKHTVPDPRAVFDTPTDDGKKATKSELEEIDMLATPTNIINTTVIDSDSKDFSPADYGYYLTEDHTILSVQCTLKMWLDMRNRMRRIRKLSENLNEVQKLFNCTISEQVLDLYRDDLEAMTVRLSCNLNEDRQVHFLEAISVFVQMPKTDSRPQIRVRDMYRTAEERPQIRYRSRDFHLSMYIMRTEKLMPSLLPEKLTQEAEAMKQKERKEKKEKKASGDKNKK